MWRCSSPGRALLRAQWEKVNRSAPLPPAGASTGGGQVMRAVSIGCAGDPDMLKGLGQVEGQTVRAAEERQQ